MPTKSVLKPLSARLLAAGAIALALAGCKHTDHEQVLGWSLIDPAQRHPIMVTQAPTSIEVDVSRGRPGLAPDQRAGVVEFLRRYKRESTTGKLVISAPSGAPNEVAAVQAAGIVKGLARSEGIAWGEIEVQPYTAEDANPQPPLKVSFISHAAEAPDCGRWPGNLADEPRNLPYANMGCANQRNLAAMVANPQDLLTPRAGSTPRLSERRDQIWDKWVKGEATGARKSDDEKVKVKNSE
jgi:pilus assembly protein CpaD